MKIIKTFEEFIEEGIVRKITPDKQRSKNLIQESNKKLKRLDNLIKVMSVDDNNANDYIEYCYNILMFLIRAEMLKEGFSSSGKGAHEAEIAFTRKLKFSETEIHILDELRFFRNGILYYGKDFDKEYADKIIVFTKTICSRKL